VESLADVAAEKISLGVNMNGVIATLTIRRGERPFHFGTVSYCDQEPAWLESSNKAHGQEKEVNGQSN
jgi:hypothetical protein